MQSCLIWAMCRAMASNTSRSIRQAGRSGAPERKREYHDQQRDPAQAPTVKNAKAVHCVLHERSHRSRVSLIPAQSGRSSPKAMEQFWGCSGKIEEGRGLTGLSRAQHAARSQRGGKTLPYGIRADFERQSNDLSTQCRVHVQPACCAPNRMIDAPARQRRQPMRSVILGGVRSNMPRG